MNTIPPYRADPEAFARQMQTFARMREIEADAARHARTIALLVEIQEERIGRLRFAARGCVTACDFPDALSGAT